MILGPTMDGGAVLVGVSKLVAVAVGSWLEIGAKAVAWVAVRTEVVIVGWSCGYVHTLTHTDGIELSDLDEMTIALYLLKWT